MRAVYRYCTPSLKKGEVYNGMFSAEKEEVETYKGFQSTWTKFVPNVSVKEPEVIYISEFRKEDLILVSDNQEFVRSFDEQNMAFGFNPLELEKENKAYEIAKEAQKKINELNPPSEERSPSEIESLIKDIQENAYEILEVEERGFTLKFHNGILINRKNSFRNISAYNLNQLSDLNTTKVKRLSDGVEFKVGDVILGDIEQIIKSFSFRQTSELVYQAVINTNTEKSFNMSDVYFLPKVQICKDYDRAFDLLVECDEESKDFVTMWKERESEGVVAFQKWCAELRRNNTDDPVRECAAKVHEDLAKNWAMKRIMKENYIIS